MPHSQLARDLADCLHQRPLEEHRRMRTLRQKLARMPDVAIVGAGVSGLRCAEVLLRSGVRVTIYEARNRIGGRVHQQRSGGYLMDMGPNWIHGNEGNPIVKLAQQTETATMHPPEVTSIFDTTGRQLPEDVAEEIAETMWTSMASAFKFSNDHPGEIDVQTSLFDHLISTLTPAVSDKETLEHVLHETRIWGNFVGDSVERQSLKFFFLEETIDNENAFVASTYKPILDTIAHPAIVKDIIKFNTQIARFSRLKDSAQITSSTGKTYTHDEVVITCPLGWLKRNTKAFTPALPPRMSEAITNISYGRLEKLYITFPSAYWLLNSPNSSKEPSYPCFTHFHPPTYHPWSSSQPFPSPSWNQSLLSLSHLPSPHDHPTLLFYLHGPCSTTVVEALKPHRNESSEYFDVLRSFAEPFYSRLPNYDASNPQCVPTAMMATNWQNDEFAGWGSYCNFQVGLEAGDEDIRVMRDGAGMGRFGSSDIGADDAQKVAVALSERAEKDFRKDNAEREPSATAHGSTVLLTKAIQASHSDSLPITSMSGQPTPPSDSKSPSNKASHADRDLAEDLDPSPGGIHFAGEHTAPFVALGTTTGAYWSGEGVARRLLGKWGIEIPQEH
jgi:predicted NAD/FAD-dependent oxidoreductase